MFLEDTDPVENGVSYLQFPKVFFDPTIERKYPQFDSKPSDDEIRTFLASPDCPLNNIIVSEQNRGNMDKLKAYTFGAFRKYDHNCSGNNFGIYAGPGQGKTTIVKAFIDTIDVPSTIIQSDTLKTTWQLWNEIKIAFEQHRIKLVANEDGYSYTLPPCIIMFDEAHNLSRKLRTGGLLNAMEHDDAILKTSDPSNKGSHAFVIDCANVCWICASTDPGIIFETSEAFYSRFSEHIVWNPANQNEVSEIVFQKMTRDNTPLPLEVCNKIAFYCNNPRKAYAFARNVELQKNHNNLCWTEAVEKLARDSGIDEFGMNNQQIQLMTELGQRVMSKKNLALLVRCRIEELESMILPVLLSRGLVAITNRGCAMTLAGLKELDKRDIKHRGEVITVEHLIK